MGAITVSGGSSMIEDTRRKFKKIEVATYRTLQGTTALYALVGVMTLTTNNLGWLALFTLFYVALALFYAWWHHFCKRW
jgi:hypothetical protein